MHLDRDADRNGKIPAPWYAHMTSQMGPVIVVMFVLLWLVIKLILGPLNQIVDSFSEADGKHEQILEETNLSNHFLWANCVNAAETKEERERCVPPPGKRSASQSYFQDVYDQPLISQRPAGESPASEAPAVQQPTEQQPSSVRGQASGSSSSPAAAQSPAPTPEHPPATTATAAPSAGLTVDIPRIDLSVPF